jgi:rhodanese-related sulfurtransferase
MFSFIRNIFSSNKPDIEALLENGALVIDVRTPDEFKQGHAKNARNIPLQSLQSKMASLRKKKTIIITCCASGMRSGKAAKILTNAGLEAHNGGPWQRVESLLNESNKNA